MPLSHDVNLSIAPPPFPSAITADFEFEGNVILGTPFGGFEKTAFEAEVGKAYSFGAHAGYNAKHDGNSYSSEYTTTWSYATSDDPLLAG